MENYRISMWSQRYQCIINSITITGTRIESENLFSDFWNNSSAVIAEPGRFRAYLHELGGRRAISTIG